MPATFSLLVGVLLTDQEDTDGGNLWVWPGSHLLAAEFFHIHGSSALTSAQRIVLHCR